MAALIAAMPLEKTVISVCHPEMSGTVSLIRFSGIGLSTRSYKKLEERLIGNKGI